MTRINEKITLPRLSNR